MERPGVPAKLFDTITRQTPALRTAVVIARVLRLTPPGSPSSQPMANAANTSSDMPANARSGMPINVSYCTTRISPSNTKLRIVVSRFAGFFSLSAQRGRHWRTPSPMANGKSWANNRVPTSFMALICRGSSPATSGTSNCKSNGAINADDPARSTINPTETTMFPRARPVNGGP